MNSNVFVGLDIGTTKIACVISEYIEDKGMKVIGIGISPSHGLRKGVVINIDKTVSAIKKAVEEAELMAGVDVDKVYVGIAGDHIRSINSQGVVAIKGEDRGITHADVERAKDNAKAVNIPHDREILHVIPHEYVVDDQTGIRDPVGMCGVRLETQVHIITGAATSAMNLNKSVKKAGFEVADLVLEPIASSYSVLGEDEKELGVALIDMGGGTTDIAIYSENSLKYPGVVSLGGENVTKDIAIGIRTPVEKAEEIKKKSGCAFSALVKESEFVNVPGVGGRDNREVSRTALASIIEPRMEEILNIVEREIQNSKYAEMLGAGIVLTGGGSMIEGVQELAEKVFKMPVKVGSPMEFGGLTETAQTPVHATGVGLCKYAIEQYKQGVEIEKSGVGSDFKSILAKMKEWMKEYF